MLNSILRCIVFCMPYLTGMVRYPPFSSPSLSRMVPMMLLVVSWMKNIIARRYMYGGIEEIVVVVENTPKKNAAMMITPRLIFPSIPFDFEQVA